MGNIQLHRFTISKNIAKIFKRATFLTHTVVSTTKRTIFTALHGMQTRSSDKNSVCLSVCLA